MIAKEMGEMWRPKNRTVSVGIASYLTRKTEPFSVALNTMSTSSGPVGGPDVAVNVGAGRGRVIHPGADGSLLSRAEGRREERPEPALHYCELNRNMSAAPCSSIAPGSGRYTEKIPIIASGRFRSSHLRHDVLYE